MRKLAPFRRIEKFCPLYRELIFLRSENRRLRSIVSVDPMTGLYNYRFFVSALQQEMEKTRRTGNPTSLIMIDVDFFKNINDTYGHIVGDSVLRFVANNIRKSVRTTDIVCRYGGEEFAVILPGTYLDSAVSVAERIRKTVEEASISVGRTQVRVTISLGVASFEATSSESLDEFINRADRCLLEAKRNGRNAVISDRPVRDTQISPEEKSLLLKDLIESSHQA